MNVCERCGLCCKFLSFPMEGMTEDDRRWIKSHKRCFIYKNNIIFLTTCIHLKRKNNKYICDVHNTAAYPGLCKRARCLRKTDKGLVEFIKECGLK